MEVVNALGRRKSAIARVYVNSGKGQIVINNRDYKEYFTIQQLQYIVEQPLRTADAIGKYDINVNLQEALTKRKNNSQ